MTLTNNLTDTARIWIYTSKSKLEGSTLNNVEKDLKAFAESWTAHSNALLADAQVLHNRFIVLMVDENVANTSGCSIDSSVRFLKEIAQKHNLDLFDRMFFVFKDNEAIKTADRDTFSKMYADGKINDDTVVFDTLINTKGQLSTSFEKPLATSWHARMV